MTAEQRRSSWFASSEADMRAFLDRLPFEGEDIRRDFHEYLGRLRYAARMASLKAEEILNESEDPAVRSHALILLLLLDNLAPGVSWEGTP